jgi:hypothetical protein
MLSNVSNPLLSLEIDGQTYNLTSVSGTTGHYALGSGEKAIDLPSGVVHLQLSMGPHARMEAFYISTVQDISQIFGTGGLLPAQEVQASPTDYEIEFQTERPAFVLVGESYDDGWIAAQGNTIFQHFVADSYGNGFLISIAGDVKVTVNYTKQTAHLAWVLLGALSTVLLPLVAVTMPVLRKRRKLFSMSEPGDRCH